jgi:hypothetical protein
MAYSILRSAQVSRLQYIDLEVPKKRRNLPDKARKKTDTVAHQDHPPRNVGAARDVPV